MRTQLNRRKFGWRERTDTKGHGGPIGRLGWRRRPAITSWRGHPEPMDIPRFQMHQGTMYTAPDTLMWTSIYVRCSDCTDWSPSLQSTQICRAAAKHLKCCIAAFKYLTRLARVLAAPISGVKVEPMVKTQDLNALFQGMFGAFPVDSAVLKAQFEKQSALTDKLSAIALDSADQSAALTAQWTAGTLTKLAGISRATQEPADYAKASADFVTTSAEATAGHFAAIAEIAKNAQTQTVELMMAAARDVSEEFSSAAKKAQSNMAASVKKVTKAAK